MSTEPWTAADTRRLRDLAAGAETGAGSITIEPRDLAGLLAHLDRTDGHRRALVTRVEELTLDRDSWRGETRAVLAKMEAMRERHAKALADRDERIASLRHEVARKADPLAAPVPA